MKSIKEERIADIHVENEAFTVEQVVKLVFPRIIKAITQVVAEGVLLNTPIRIARFSIPVQDNVADGWTDELEPLTGDQRLTSFFLTLRWEIEEYLYSLLERQQEYGMVTFLVIGRMDERHEQALVRIHNVPDLVPVIIQFIFFKRNRVATVRMNVIFRKDISGILETREHSAEEP